MSEQELEERNLEEPKRVRTPPENPLLMKKVREWVKWSKFSHVGPTCKKCGKATYIFNEEDNEGFCVECFNRRWPHPSHGPAPKSHGKKQKKQVIVEQSESQRNTKEDTRKRRNE